MFEGAAIYNTSVTHPLDIAVVEVAPSYGRIGVSACPGRKQLNAPSGPWYRQLDIDLNDIRNWGAVAVITVAQQRELLDLDVGHIESEVRARHMDWVHLPLRPGRSTGWLHELHWAKAGPVLRAWIRHGFDVLIHSRAGTHRAAQLAVRLLIELGIPQQGAVRRVHSVRPEAAQSAPSPAHLAAIKYCPEPWPDTGPAAVADRAMGALLGLMVGEAQALTRAALPADQAPIDSPQSRLSAAQDALALANRLLQNPYADTADFIGKRRSQLMAAPETSQRVVGRASDGCLLRLAPLAIRFHRDRQALRAAVAHQTRRTHPAPEAVDASLGLAEILADAISGRPATMVLTQPNFIGTDAIATVVAGSWRGRRRTDIQTSGLARHSLEAALWATARSASFEQAVTLAIGLNSKNPVLAALTGQLSGALLGARAIPTRWRRDLPLHAMIHSVTHGLLRQS